MSPNDEIGANANDITRDTKVNSEKVQITLYTRIRVIHAHIASHHEYCSSFLSDEYHQKEQDRVVAKVKMIGNQYITIR